MPILSTGGAAEDAFLNFVGKCFNARVVKCSEFLKFAMLAIDYLNNTTNDCFFTLDKKSQNVINHSGKLHPEKPKQHFFSLKGELYPYLLVNLRSGTSYYRVDSATESRRIVGSPIGSNVFMGILRLLGGFNDPTEAVTGAISGDSSNIDLSVGDIYGGSYGKLGLPPAMIASSFGKLKTPESLKNADKNDISRSLLTMVSVNALSLCRMIMQLEKIKNVIWIGTHIDML
jgi:pantothenate kinase